MSFRPHTKIIQIMGILPLFMIVFYSGYGLLRLATVKKKYLLAVTVCIGVALIMLGFGYTWVYNLMPRLGIEIYYFRSPNEYEAYLEEAIALFYRFLICGAAFALAEDIQLQKYLRVMVLALQISPHHLRHIWTLLLLRVSSEDPTEISHMKGEIGLAEYSARIPDFPRGLVTIELEILQLEKLIRSYSDRDIDYKIIGETAGQRILPNSILTLVTNAFKYSDRQFPIEIIIDLRSGIDISVQNRIDDQRHYQSGLGTGLANLHERLTLLFPKKHTLNTGIVGDSFIAKLHYKK